MSSKILRSPLALKMEAAKRVKEWCESEGNRPALSVFSHDNNYRTCIVDSDMASVLIRSLCFKHLILNKYILVLSHVVFMQSLYPPVICKKKKLLVPFIFLLLLTIAIIRMNVQTGI